MKLKRFSLVTLVVGVLFLTIGIITPFIVLQNYTNHTTVDIIGGADTPTIKYIIFRLMDGLPFIAILFGVALIISAVFCFIFSKTIQNYCSIKTTALSLGLSIVGALGFLCAFWWLSIVAFDQMSKYPIEYPVSLLLGIICLVAFILLAVFYFKLRKTNWSFKGIAIDFLTSIVYLPTFFFTFEYFLNMFT